MNRASKLAVKELNREVCALQVALAGKRPPHGEPVLDAEGRCIRMKWPSNFNRAERELQSQFQRLIDLKRLISEAARTGRLAAPVEYSEWIAGPDVLLRDVRLLPPAGELQTEGAC